MKCLIVMIVILFSNFSYGRDFSILCDSSFLQSTTASDLSSLLVTISDKDRENRDWVQTWFYPGRSSVTRVKFLQVCDELTGDTPLHVAARVGANLNVMRILIQRERGFTQQYPLSSVLLRRNAEGQTPFEILRDRVTQNLSAESINKLDTLLRLYALHYIHLM